MAEAAAAKGTVKAVELVVDSISTPLGYIRNYKANFEDLERQHQKLEGTRDQVQHSVDEALRNGEEIEQNVENWLGRVKKINAEVTKIIEDNKGAYMCCFRSLCPDLKKRYQHSKKAALMGMEVSKLETEGKFNKVSYRNPPKETWHPSSKLYQDIESRRSTVENILNALRNPDINMVGVHGMGGIGKTTLAKEVGKQAEEQRLFDALVFVEITEKPDIMKIQGAIADKLGLEFREVTESGRARKLCERLKKESKILLILDNIWKGLDLEIVGIPFANDHPGCKLLLTARSIDVLSNDMNSLKNFPVGELDEKEAWDLFKTAAGACIEQHGLQLLASEVAKRCGGLPIAIVTIAKALKDKQEHAWRTALLELQRPSFDNLLGSVTAEAYSCIQFSYYQLNSDELKSTFLLCCTMAFTSNASFEELLRYGKGLSLFRTVYTMEEARDKVNTLVKKLKDSSLLLDTPDGEEFSIHDVVRDVGRAIAINDHNNYTVNDNGILRDLAEENTLKNCTSITLHDIAELPEELDCPQLKFLYVKPKARFSKIPVKFFTAIPELEVLHLIEMVLSPLPASFYLLKKLQTLNLDRCHLGDTVDIGNLKNLKILVLSSDIKQLSEEIGELTRLKVLDLSNCSYLQVIPPNTISRLTQLEELYMPDEFDKWQVEGVDSERSNVSLGELEHLSQLTALQIYIPDAKLVPKGLLFQKLQRYTIYMGVEGWGRDATSRVLVLKYDDANISVEDGIIKQLKEIEDLQLIGKQGVKNVIYELNRDGFPKLKHFRVESNPELVYIVDFPKQSEPCVAFPHLQTLSLLWLSSLEKICHGQFTLTPNSFCQLRTLEVYSCVKLKNIFSSSIATRHLSQLERILVNSCSNMEEIFSIVGNENEEIVLEKLDYLKLWGLPKLRSFTYDEEEVGSTCDEERQMKDSLMPLFDGKVKFRNLKTIYLGAINLKYVFSSSTLGSFVQLQSLEIRWCSVLEEIIRIDHDLKNNVELPSLKNLKIEKCPAMKSFIFSDKVTFPSLEEIEISDMDNLEMIWHNQFEDSQNVKNCQKLCKVSVSICQSLKNLFPASIVRNLWQLKDIYVGGCGIKEIIAKKEGAEEAGDKMFLFPELTSLSLHYLQELKCLYPGIHTTKWPMLKKLNVFGCDKIDASEFFNIQEVISEDLLDIVSQGKVLPNLEELGLDGRIIKMVWQRPFPEILFPKLKFLEIQNDESMVLSPNSLPRSHNLERLSLKNSSYEWIFSFEEIEEYAQIKSLYVTGLGNLKQICKQDSKVDTILQNLEKLVVGSCGSLVTLLPPSTSFQNLTVLTVYSCKLINLISSSTAKSLMQLKEMEISYCNMMTEVVTGDEAGIEDQINFKNLKSLKLITLSRLRRFCSGNYNFNFPSLEILKVNSCPKMWIFSSKATNTPMLREIRLEWKSYYCDGDVNKTMERKHEKEVFSSDELTLSANEIRMILQKFPEHKFSKVQTLEVFDDESTVFPLDILQRFQNLNCLQLSDTSYKEIFSCEEMEKHAETLAQIKDLSLEKLDDLEQMWKQDSRSDLILHNLGSLEVVECNSLITLMPTSASYQNLRSMKISGCNGLRSLVTAAVAKSLVQLVRMRIKNCNEMTEVVAIDGDVKEGEIIFNNLKELELTNLSNLTSFYSGNYTLNFPSLNELQVTRCPKMKFFSSGISSTPMLQQMWKQDSRSDLILHNLESLEVVECNSLITLVPISASFQNLGYMEISGCNGLRSLVTAAVAKSLVQLWHLLIRNCNEMTEIVAIGDVKEDEIIFNKLRTLELTDLSNLTSFYSGNYTLNFPYLTNLKVTRCPKMKFFSSGISSMPMLQQIKRGSSKYNLEGDLNTTIQRIHEEMNVENSMEDCAGPSTQHLE